MRIRHQAFIGGTILLGIAVLGLKAQQAKNLVKDRPSAKSPPAVRVWKSDTTGKEYRVWVENQQFHAEWVNLPPELVKNGAYVRSQCRRVGTKWVGTSRSHLPCESVEENKPVKNWCHLQTRIEFDSVTAQRITGRGEGLKRFDCRTCQVLETYWADFVWKPKR